MKRATVVTVLVAMLLALLSAGDVLAAPGTFITIQLTANDGPDLAAWVSGDRVVWCGAGGSDGGSDYEVFTWTPAVGTVQLTENNTADYSGGVSGDRVVWDGRGSASQDIFTWTPADGTVPLTTDASHDYHPQISGDRIVWSGFSDLFTWTPGGGDVRLTTDSMDGAYPRVSGDRVVWCGKHGSDGGTDYEVFTWTPAGGVVQLAANNTEDWNARVLGNRIVWTGSGGTDGGTDYEVFTWTPAGGIVQLIANGTEDTNGWVSGDRVVWYGRGGSDGGPDYEVFTWTPTGGVVQLTQNNTDEWDPLVSGDRIVWSGTGGTDGGADREIFTWTPAGGTSQVTSNSTDDLSAVVSGDRMVWYGVGGSDGGIDSEIFTAVLAPAQTFPDVLYTHPYYTAIGGMASRGVIGGYTNGNFGPGDLVIRQQFAKMIVKTFSLTVTGNEVCPFVDVVPGTGTDPFYPLKYVAVCAQNNITKGVDATHFNPYANITRQQVITMVVRAADNLAPGTLQPVPDGFGGVLPAGDPTHGANIRKAEYNGLLDGIWASNSTPALAGWDTGGNASRGEVAQILWNLLAKRVD